MKKKKYKTYIIFYFIYSTAPVIPVAGRLSMSTAFLFWHSLSFLRNDPGVFMCLRG